MMEISGPEYALFVIAVVACLIPLTVWAIVDLQRLGTARPPDGRDGFGDWQLKRARRPGDGKR